MFKMVVFACFMVITSYSYSQKPEWTLVHPSSPQVSLSSIAAIDSLHAFVVGEFPRIGYTSDGGKTWGYISVNVPNTDSAATFTSIHFTNKLNGWAASGLSGIARTTDGGATWAWGDITFKNRVINNNLSWSDVDFKDDNTGFAVGGWEGDWGYFGIIARTTDGGKTWITLMLDSVRSHLTSCAFSNSKIGIVAGTNGCIGRTTDGGVTWSYLKNSGDGVPRYVSILPDSTCIVASQYKYMFSNNMGLSWTISDNTSTILPKAMVSFTDSLHGWGAVGFSNNKRQYILTSDGGKSWYYSIYPQHIWDNSQFIIVSSAVGFDSSLWICESSGKILRSVDAGRNWESMSGFNIYLDRIQFTTPSIALMSCSNKLYRFVTTTDGGKNWVPHLSADTSIYIYRTDFYK